MANARRAARISLRGNDLLIAPEASAGEEPTAALRAELAAVVPASELLFDSRLGAYRTLPQAYRAVSERLARDDYLIEVAFEPAPALPFVPQLSQSARPYQREAIERWERAGRRGVVVLPTGAGKTLVALLAIDAVRQHTLVVVPTLDLLEQWRRTLIEQLGAPAEHVASFGGGRQDIGPLTVMTYDSAAIHTRELNSFGLLVFDEVHHLPAASYRRAAEGAIAPHRLGLSATPERTDGKEADLERLVGPTVYVRTPRELSAHLAAFREERIDVALSPDEQERYERARSAYRDFIRRRRLRITSPEDFQRWVIWPSANDPEARTAMLAHREARQLAFNAEGKLETLRILLLRHAADRVIVFAEFNRVVEDVSRALLVPSITHRTPAVERQSVLDRFRSGRYSKLVTGRVLNDGVDVPDANVAIVLSGTATRREYVQRLGRVLRPKEGEAVLYELVSAETDELHVTARRHTAT